MCIMLHKLWPISQIGRENIYSSTFSFYLRVFSVFLQYTACDILDEYTFTSLWNIYENSIDFGFWVQII